MTQELDWSEWRAFPDPRDLGYLHAPFGPGVYELRLRGSHELVYCGSAGNTAQRMTSLLPRPFGAGTRDNAGLREFLLQHLERVEYRTAAMSEPRHARVLETLMHRNHRYLF